MKKKDIAVILSKIPKECRNTLWLQDLIQKTKAHPHDNVTYLMARRWQRVKRAVEAHGERVSVDELRFLLDAEAKVCCPDIPLEDIIDGLEKEHGLKR